MANRNVTKFLDDLKKPANINNTNNYNNSNDTKDKLTTTIHCQESNAEEVESLASPSLGRLRLEKESLDSKSRKKVAVKLPPEWRGIKLDLYCNGTNKNGTASLRLNLGVIRSLDGDRIPLMAALNSSWDDGVRRGVDKEAWSSDSHWIRAKQHRKELNYLYDDIRTSKIGKKTKQGGTNWVAYVYADLDTSWCVDILRDAQVYTFKLTDQMSLAQQEQGNMIATGYFGIKKKALIDPKKEWGI